MRFTVHQNYEIETKYQKLRYGLLDRISSDVFFKLGRGIVTSKWYIICYSISLLLHLKYQSSQNPFSSFNIFKVFHQTFEVINHTYSWVYSIFCSLACYRYSHAYIYPIQSLRGEVSSHCYR